MIVPLRSREVDVDVPEAAPPHPIRSANEAVGSDGEEPPIPNDRFREDLMTQSCPLEPIRHIITYDPERA